MKSIGIFICNYNGKEDAINCIKSLEQQENQDFDIYVVDNASTDGSVRAIADQFGKKVSIIQNDQNIGGAGGFDRGLRTGIREEYKYISLLDNDIILDSKAIGAMHEFLEKNKDVGIVGSKVMIMDQPDTIQDFGNYIDFDNYGVRLGYYHQKDNDTIPEQNPCDYVPSCAIMIRTSMLKESGTMPVDNFIYYDDIELSYKMNLKGYKVVAINTSKVWHKGGFNKAIVNTFSKYYFLRNSLNFFAKYSKQQDMEKFADTIVTDVYTQLYGTYNKKMKEIFETTMYAFDDFIHCIRGKSDEYKINSIVKRETPFEEIIKGKNRILIKMIDNYNKYDELDIYHVLLHISESITKNNSNVEIRVSLEEALIDQLEFQNKLDKAYESYHYYCTKPELRKDIDDFDIVLRLCEHVKMVDKDILPEIYVDKYCNCIVTSNHYDYFRSFETNLQMFKAIYKPMVMQAITKIRE